MGDITRELSQCGNGHYNVQTRVQAQAQANAPTAVDTQPIAQKVTPNSDKSPSKMKEKSNVKRLPSRIIQQSPKGITLPPETIFPPIVPQISGHHQSHQMSKKPLQAQI